MFISFFTGKVMLFYGISLIMKEKSNASALDSLYLIANLGRDATEPGTRRNRTWDVTRPNLGRRSLASLLDGLSGRRQRCCDGWKSVWFPVAS